MISMSHEGLTEDYGDEDDWDDEKAELPGSKAETENSAVSSSHDLF